MPKTKLESVIFTAVTAWIMVYIMTLYNTVLAMGSFTNATFLIALKGMWIEFIIIFLCYSFHKSITLIIFVALKKGQKRKAHRIKYRIVWLEGNKNGKC